jgi:1-deoxy-D-xylulose 5-phosphate reductoisomerase
VKILPVDSEHSAIFQCLEGCQDPKHLKKLILTASGGPFFGKTKKELQNVTLTDALNHPSWSMGAKITIDSATMMNKGLEIIEAVHLFGMPPEKIDVVIHPQSVVHSMIEYIDGSVMAQMGTPSMKTPIQYALTYPERANSEVPPLNLSKFKNLSFFKPDNETFESLNICREAITSSEAACVVINAANEEAVNQFLNGKIKFLDIISLVKLAKDYFDSEKAETLNDILKIDKKVREFIISSICKFQIKL